MLKSTSIFASLLPYFVISVTIFVLLLFSIPEDMEECHEYANVDYGTSELQELR